MKVFLICICFVGGDTAGKKKKRILKRIIRTKKPDGTYTSKEIIITDPKEVLVILSRQYYLFACSWQCSL